MNKYKAKIDISKNIEVYFDVPLFTGDFGNTIELIFHNGGEPYPMTGVTVSAKRADGQTVFDMGSISGNTAQYTIANNMHNIPGNLDVQISLTDSAGAFLTSGFLHFSVEKGFSEDSGIEADDRYPIFNSFSEELGKKADVSQLDKKANLRGGNVFSGTQTFNNENIMSGTQTIYHQYPNESGAAINIISESTMPDTVIRLSDYDSGEVMKVDRSGQIWKGGKKYVTETELASKVDTYEAEIWGDLYVGQGAVIENVDNNTKPGLEINHYPSLIEGETQPTVLYKCQGVETARMDHTGQLWKGNEKYITDTEVSQSYANALVSDTAEAEMIVLPDQQPDTHMNTFTVYGVSQQDGTPTPDTPVEVVSAEDFDVVCSGKNLINESNQWYSQYGNISSTFADGVWTITNTHTANRTARFDIGALPAGTYTMSFSKFPSSPSLYVDDVKTWQTSTSPKTFTLENDAAAVRFDFAAPANSSVTLTGFQLELGSAATQYTPYIAPYTGHITGAMRGIPKTGGWAFRDYIESDGISVWKVQECGYTTLTGAESWSVSANTIADGTVFSITLPDQDKSTTQKLSLLSNRFTALKSGTAPKLGNTWQTNVTFFTISNTDTGITSEDTDAVKLQKYKAWLAENNVTILYQLASPVRTDITGTEAGQAILSAVRTKNIVSVRTENLETNTVNPLYQANYNQDINKVINELKQIIVSLGGVIS